MNEKEIRNFIVTNLSENERIAENRQQRLVSFGVTICWVLLGSVAIVLTRRWSWGVACGGIGMISLLQGRWRLPN